MPRNTLDTWLVKLQNPNTSDDGIKDAEDFEKPSFSDNCIKEPQQSEEPSDDIFAEAGECSKKKMKWDESVASSKVEESQHCCERDIGLYLNKSIDDSLKERLLNSPWTPTSSFEFPTVSTRKLKFQLKWMDRFHWLVYSKHANGALCKVCVLFGKSTGGRGGQQLGALVTKSFSAWKNALEVFISHSETKYHKFCVEAADNFQSVCQGEKLQVIEQVNADHVRQAQENRRKLIPIVETIIFCGRQEFPLRGTNDHGNVTKTSYCNDGNFRALLRFRITAGDAILKDHLEKSAHNAKYCSPRIQNELINICGDIIVEKIVQNVNRARCFSVLADETCDISNKEQMSVCLRYINDEDEKLCENFFQFVPLEDLKGESIARSILSCLRKKGINTEFMVGQGYDGAASMSGHIQGAQAFVRRECPAAIYVHCSAHSLNLAIGDSCKLPIVRNCLGSVAAVTSFFSSSPLRTQVLKSAIEQSFPTSKYSKILPMCETRWVLKRESLHRFKEVLIPLLQALNELQESHNSETALKAHQFSKILSSGEFIIALFVIEKVFSFTLSLCLMLQKTEIDLASACEYVDDILNMSQDVRSNAEVEFHEIFSEATKVMDTLGEQFAIPRIVKKQIHRENSPSLTPESYFRKNLFIPFFDHFTMQLQDRFSRHKNLLCSIQKIIPKHSVTSKPNDLEECVNTFKAFLPEHKIFESEFRIWQSKWSKIPVQNQPTTAIQGYFSCNVDLFPNVKKLLQILSTIPVSTASAERSFSTLRRLKNYLRNSTGQDRLTGLALLSVHRKIPVEPEEVIRRFALTPRRENFVL